MSDEVVTQAFLGKIEATETHLVRLTKERVAAAGRHPACSRACRLPTGECASDWCEARHLEVRRGNILVCL